MLDSAGLTAPTISRLPNWLDPADVDRVEVTGDALRFAVDRPRTDAWPRVGDGLRRAGAALKRIRTAELVQAVDRAARQWCERDWPPRRRARDLAAATTGMSVESVDRSFDVELRNYRAASLWAALHREFDDPLVLDEPRSTRHFAGRTMAVGPALVCQAMTGNVPGLPALGLVRALLVKSAVVMKVASGEPTFAARFAETLAQVEPRIGDAVLVTYWARDDYVTRDAVLAEADVVIAYGSDEACAALHAATHARQKFVSHDHKLSVGVLSKEFQRTADPGTLAAEVARDASMFDQHACIAPQAYFVEGDLDAVARLGERVALAMERYAASCPLGHHDPAAVAGRRMRAVEAEFHAARALGRRTWAGADWLVTVDDGFAGADGTGDRALRLVAVPSLDDVLDQLRPFGTRLQNVAAGVSDGEMPEFAISLARLGATRLCRPGRMPDPSMAWRHDGQPRLAELVRWCDVEMHHWAEPRSEEE
ncbi:acyl-CoA reductase [Amycolatopsis lurida]